MENITGAYEAYKSLRPVAFRADLWRYMILWAEGSVYMDIKMNMMVDPSTWINFDSDSLVLVEGDACPTFWNRVMAARARTKQLRGVIAHVLRNVQRLHYREQSCGISYLWITGPGALAEALLGRDGKCKNGKWSDIAAEEHVAVPLILGPLPWGTPTQVRYVPVDLVIATNDFQAQHCGTGGAPHYSALYSSHQVYFDEAGPLCHSGCPSEPIVTQKA